MATIAIAVVLFVLLPVLALLRGAESRPGFDGRPDWRSLNS